MSSWLLVIAVFGPLVAGAYAVVVRSLDRAGRLVTAGCGLSTLAAGGLLVASGRSETGDVGDVAWLDLRLDRPSALLLAVAVATATVVAGFSRRSLDDDGRAGLFFGLIGFVATGSALVVVPGSAPVLLVGWFLSGGALVALIGFEGRWRPAQEARRRVLRTLLVGDVALVAAVVVAGVGSDGLFTGDVGAAVAQLRGSSIGGVSALHVFAILMVVAGASRSALVPFHRWLIGTLVAPTPVSALVHAGFVSGAGLLLIRFAAPFAASGAAVTLAFAAGVVTVVVASAASLLRSDVKGRLAWSTVAQMAFMVVQCAVGAFSSAVFHIAGHGMYKAALFLGAGDSVADGLLARRRPGGLGPASAAIRRLVVVLVPAVAVWLAVAVVPPDVSDGGRVLVVVFAWLSVAFALNGWLARGPFGPTASIMVGSTAAVVSAFAYVAGLRLVEYFVKPSLLAAPEATAIGPVTLLITLAAVAAVVAAVAFWPGPGGTVLRARAQAFIVTVATPGVGPSLLVGGRSGPGSTAAATTPWAGTPPADGDEAGLARIRADVARAGDIIAPQWPLASFVAVNPLGGLESAGFDQATAAARRWLRSRTHLSLQEYRRDHERGLTGSADLAHAIHQRFTGLGARGPIEIDGRLVDPVDVVVTDLLHGPDTDPEPPPRTALERLGPGFDEMGDTIDRIVSEWLAAYVSPPPLARHHRGEHLVPMCRRLAAADPRVIALVGPGAADWIAGLDDDPAAVINAAFSVAGVTSEQRVDEIRGHLARLIGWSGFGKWRNEWAQPDEQHPPLAPIDVAAARAILEAAVIGSLPARRPGEDQEAQEPGHAKTPSAAADRLDERVRAVARVLAPRDPDGAHAAVAGILGDVPAEVRPSLWLDAQEHNLGQRLLTTLDRLDPGPTLARPDAQSVFCIDVRSEGLRRHLEATGNVETLGFAGFFGVPMRIRRLGWDHTEARCPVLVAPAIDAVEHVRSEEISAVATGLSRQRALAGLQRAHVQAKNGPGGPFVLAESLGWLLGPIAAARTFLPRRSRPAGVPATRMLIDDDDVLVEQRVFFAEAVLNTMGLTGRFAPIVLLCGHTSNTTNNPHATALECGACAGASGDDNARAVAALLNSPDVRNGLIERGITIPDDTWFVAGLHDTASDHVTLLDIADAPAGHRQRINDLAALLADAGRRQAADRAEHLPGPAAAVRDRGSDWAQVRPEWGLARNAAFIIGPRSMTGGLDLDGRAFLHSYDADNDPSGRVLETIMTAPLVVGHWISAQYYFSTVDPEVFGSGNKLIHNPIGTTGVISGEGGDLRVGLPLQSTHVDDRRYHQPVRLMAVIQAELTRIENIIADNPILQTLTAGSWLRIAGRSHPHEPWSIRTPQGTWITSPRPLDPTGALTSTLADTTTEKT